MKRSTTRSIFSARPKTQKTRMSVVVVIVALLLSSSAGSQTASAVGSVAAAPGDLDPAFGVGGKVTSDPFGSGSSTSLNALAIQRDGKIITAGAAAGMGGTDFAVVRLNPNGDVDTSFGFAGKVLTDFDFGIDEAIAAAIQPDGKIVAAGYTFNRTTISEDFAIVRYNPDGSLDSTFGSGGRVTTEFGRYRDRIGSIVVQPDGKIIAVGITADPGPVIYDFALARYNPSGSLGSSFGVAGIVMTDFGGFDDASSVALQPDGKIIVVGRTVSPSNPFLSDFAMARYETDGSLDMTFGNSGRIITDFFGSLDEANSVILQPDGKIIAAGNAATTTNRDFAIARYDIKGSLDPAFGVGGKIVTNFVGGADVISRIALQKNGAIVAAGTSENAQGFDFALARYRSDGSLDTTFGNNGKVTTDFFGSSDAIRDMLIQPDGKILTGGVGVNLGATPPSEFALARYLGDTPFDMCLQDDSNGNLLQFNSTTGEYQFTKCRSGLVLSGTGSLTTRGSIITLQDYATDRRVLARIDGSVNKGTASIQVFSQGTTFTIMDRNTTNNTCTCP